MRLLITTPRKTAIHKHAYNAMLFTDVFEIPSRLRFLLLAATDEAMLVIDTDGSY